jgi:hypothetical protein
MNVKIFIDSANHSRFQLMLEEFARGVAASGDLVSIERGLYTPDDNEESIPVIFGSWKDRPDLHHVVKNSVVNQAKNFIVMETPLVGRGPVSDVMEDNWYRVGLNGFLADTGNFNNVFRDNSRWLKVQKELGVELKPWHADGQYILLALQLPGDASLRGKDISLWAYETCHEIRKYTDRPIVIRTPQLPRNFDTNMFFKLNNELKDIMFETGSKLNLNSSLDNAWCTVTYSSGLGIDSVLRGTRAYAMDKGSFVHSLGYTDLSTIEDKESFPEREQWLNDLCYAQWNIDEMREGLVWSHMKELLR